MKIWAFLVAWLVCLKTGLFVAHRDSYTIVDCHWQSPTQWGLLSFSAIKFFSLLPPAFMILVSLFHVWILLVMNLSFGLNFFMVYTLQSIIIVLAWAGSRIWCCWFLCCNTYFFSWMNEANLLSALFRGQAHHMNGMKSAVRGLYSSMAIGLWKHRIPSDLRS